MKMEMKRKWRRSKNGLGVVSNLYLGCASPQNTPTPDLCSQVHVDNKQEARLDDKVAEHQSLGQSSAEVAAI